MFQAKLSRGFLEVFTDDGVRYVRPLLLERLRLIWIFRNFSVVSQQVLSARQQQLVSSLCSQDRLISSLELNERENNALIGKLDTTTALPKPNPDERRKSPRSTLHFEVRYGIGRHLFEGEGKNYSTGGLAFSGPRQYPVGAELDLSYRLKPESNWIRVRALVRRREAGVMGVEFLKGSAE
jgi:hypothetical protein